MSYDSYCCHISRRRLWFYNLLCRIPIHELVHFLKKILNIRRECVTTRHGFKIFVDPVTPLGLELLATGEFEPNVSRLFQLVLRPQDVCIDVGAYEGYFSLLAAGLVKEGIVFSIEPQPQLQPIIKHNAEINSLKNIKVFQLALSDLPSGKVKLYIAPSIFSACSSIIYKRWDLLNSVDVPATTLDSFINNMGLTRVRLVKIDTEGAEYRIIQGAKETLRQQRVDFFAFSYHFAIIGRELGKKIHYLFYDNGYVMANAEGQSIYHLKGLEDTIAELEKKD